MAHAIWSGSISFGLVTIPVKLFTAVRENELHFNMLHNKDKGRIGFVRTCNECGKKVEWADIIKGYEHEKGDYVVVTDEDFKRVNPEATQSVEIVAFVDLDEINPMLFDKPYYLEPEKKGRHAYALLRKALEESGKVGIAKVVIRTKEYLAALKPQGPALILELMHYPDEIVETDDFDFPKGEEKVPAGEMKAAKMLIDTMADKFKPEEFKDHYRDQLLEMIEARANGKPQAPAAKRKAPSSDKVVNLMDILQRSLKQRGRREVAQPREGKRAAAGARRKAAVAGR